MPYLIYVSIIILLISSYHLGELTIITAALGRSICYFQNYDAVTFSLYIHGQNPVNFYLAKCKAGPLESHSRPKHFDTPV